MSDDGMTEGLRDLDHSELDVSCYIPAPHLEQSTNEAIKLNSWRTDWLLHSNKKPSFKFDIDSEELVADRKALMDKTVCFFDAAKACRPPEVLESEKCLLNITKPRSHYVLPIVSQFEARRKYPDYGCCIDDAEWLELKGLILKRDGEGIINWFSLRHVSRKQQVLVEKDNDSALAVAAGIGSLPIFEFLMGESFCLGIRKRPMWEALRNNHIHIVNKLLEIGAGVNEPIIAPSFGAIGVNHLCPLQCAAGNTTDSSMMIQFLISKGADLETIHFETPLQIAVLYGHPKNVIALIKAGATSNPNSEMLNCKESLLYLAASTNARMVNIIRTAYPHLNTSGFVMSKAIREGKVDILRYFVQQNVFLLDSMCEPAHSDWVLASIGRNKEADVRDEVLGIIIDSGNSHVQTMKTTFRTSNNYTIHINSSRKRLHHYYSHPRSLQQLACFKIRSILGLSLPVAVHQLPVPVFIKDYVQLKHL